MHILAAIGTWLGIVIVGAVLVGLFAVYIAGQGASPDTIQGMSFILGLPLGVIASLAAVAVYDRLE